MAQYHIKNNNTQYYPLSQNEKVNEIVPTADGKSSIPENSILLISPPVSGQVTTAAITGLGGLFVAPQSESDGSKLIWTDKQYLWTIRLTGTGTYQISPNDGADLYWFDKFGIGQVVEVKAGKNVVPPENDWTLLEA